MSIWRYTENAELGELLWTEHALVGLQRRGLRRRRIMPLRGLIRSNHLLIRYNVFHD